MTEMSDAELMARHQANVSQTAAEKAAAAPPLRERLAQIVLPGIPRLPGKMFSGRERDRTCPDCGKPFVQRELSEDMARWVASLPAGAQADWNSTVSENALPLLCPPCERKDLGRQNRPPTYNSGRSVGYGD